MYTSQARHLLALCLSPPVSNKSSLTSCVALGADKLVRAWRCSMCKRLLIGIKLLLAIAERHGIGSRMLGSTSDKTIKTTK